MNWILLGCLATASTCVHVSHLSPHNYLARGVLLPLFLHERELGSEKLGDWLNSHSRAGGQKPSAPAPSHSVFLLEHTVVICGAQLAKLCSRWSESWTQHPSPLPCRSLSGLSSIKSPHAGHCAGALWILSYLVRQTVLSAYVLSLTSFYSWVNRGIQGLRACPGHTVNTCRATLSFSVTALKKKKISIPLPGTQWQGSPEAISNLPASWHCKGIESQHSQVRNAFCPSLFLS